MGQIRIAKSPPESNRLAIDFQCGGDLSFGCAAGRNQHDAAPQRHLLRRSQRCQPLFDLLLLILRNGKRRGRSRHNPSMLQLSLYVHLFVGHYTSDERRNVGKDQFLAREDDPVVSMTALISASPQLFSMRPSWTPQVVQEL